MDVPADFCVADNGSHLTPSFTLDPSVPSSISLDDSQANQLVISSTSTSDAGQFNIDVECSDGVNTIEMIITFRFLSNPSPILNNPINDIIELNIDQ